MRRNPVGRISFLANVCHVCKEKRTPYTCTVCRMVFYCSPAHRRQNWYDHSPLCWALRKICRAEGVDHLLETWKGADFAGFRHDVAGKCVHLLRRRLESWELEIIYHPRICNVCQEIDWKKLQPCVNCGVVFTCGQGHFRPDHGKWCKTLKIYADIIIGSHGKSWKVPTDEINLKKSNRLTMHKVLQDFPGLKENDPVSMDWDIRKSLLSDLLTYPLTVLNSLSQIGADDRKEIRVLFIGAETQAEVEPFIKWERYLLHQLPATESLHLMFLGPELRQDVDEYQAMLCDACRCQNKKMICKFVTGKFYHEYFQSPRGQTFTLICAFNSGMYRNLGFEGEDSWMQTVLDLFTGHRSPVVLTEYTAHELKKDLEKVERLCGKVEVVAGPRQNPFGSLKPGLNLISENEIPVIFRNYFWVILRGKSLKKEGIPESNAD